MGFTSFLKRVGQDIVKGAAIGGQVIAEVEGFGPIISKLLPPSVASKVQSVASVAGSDIRNIDDIITTVEGFGQLSGMTGDQKFAAVTGAVTQTLQDALSMSGHDVQDQTLFNKSKDETTQAIKLLVQARVDFMNSISKKSQ